MSKKKIITAPHKTLRLKAKVIDELDKSVNQFLRSLQQTLVAQEKPAAAGLALPQIDLSYRAFATYLETPVSTHPQARIFVNPVIIDLSDVLSVGPDRKSPDLEGCLSIPELYGPVARPEWVTMEFMEVLNPGEDDIQLSDPKQETFYDFPGRVMQHELDHLNGILFTDYTLKQGQPLFRQEKNDLLPVDPMVVKAWS